MKILIDTFPGSFYHLRAPRSRRFTRQLAQTFPALSLTAPPASPTMNFAPFRIAGSAEIRIDRGNRTFTPPNVGKRPRTPIGFAKTNV